MEREMKYVYESQSCKICKFECMGSMKLFQHIKRLHNLNAEEYHLTYNLLGVKPTCVICGISNLKFKNIGNTINNGYAATCSDKCNNERIAKNRVEKAKALRQDPIKYAEFSEKMSNASKNIWKNRSAEENQIIREKMVKNHGTRLPPGEAVRRRKARYNAAKEKHWAYFQSAIYNTETDKQFNTICNNLSTFFNMDSKTISGINHTSLDEYCKQISTWSKK